MRIGLVKAAPYLGDLQLLLALLGEAELLFLGVGEVGTVLDFLLIAFFWGDCLPDLALEETLDVLLVFAIVILF